MLHLHPATRWLARSVLLALLLAGTAASALPVTLFANAKARSGFARADVAAAISAGAPRPIPVSGMIGGQGSMRLTTPDVIAGLQGRHKKKPVSVTSTWTLQIAPEMPAELLGEVFLVILGHDRNDPSKYKSKKVGLEISTSLPWLLLENESRPGLFHVAYALGTLEPGGTYEIPIEYRVAGKLKKKRGKYRLPRFSVAFLARPAAVVPEPGPLALLAAAAATGWLARSRRS